MFFSTNQVRSRFQMMDSESWTSLRCPVHVPVNCCHKELVLNQIINRSSVG